MKIVCVYLAKKQQSYVNLNIITHIYCFIYVKTLLLYDCINYIFTSQNYRFNKTLCDQINANKKNQLLICIGTI